MRRVILLIVAAVIAGGTLLWMRSPPVDPSSIAAEVGAPQPASRKDSHPVLATRPKPIESSAAETAPVSPARTTPEEASARRARLIDALLPQLRRDYADLRESVTLTDSERDFVLLLVADYRVQSHETELATATDGVAGAQALESLQKQRRFDLVRFLGEDRTAQVLAFEDTLPLRMEIRLLAEQLSETAWPMSPEQSRRFIAAAIEAFDRQPATEVGRSGAENPDAVEQEDQARLDQSYATLLRVARGVLNAEQFAYYEHFMEQREDFHQLVD